jgi:transposase
LDSGGSATAYAEVDDRGEIVWNPVFLDFARYWGFTPRLCRPYRAQTNGKVESGVKYVRRNFLCGLQGREPSGLDDLNAQLRALGVGSRQPACAWHHTRAPR